MPAQMSEEHRQALIEGWAARRSRLAEEKTAHLPPGQVRDYLRTIIRSGILRPRVCERLIELAEEDESPARGRKRKAA